MLLLIQVDQASAEDVFIILHGPLDIQTGLLIVLGFLNVLFQFIELLVCRNNHDYCDCVFYLFIIFTFICFESFYLLFLKHLKILDRTSDCRLEFLQWSCLWMCYVQEVQAEPILWLCATRASTALLQAGPAGSGCVQPAEVSSATAWRISGKIQITQRHLANIPSVIPQRNIQELKSWNRSIGNRFSNDTLILKLTFDLHWLSLAVFS